MRSTPYSEQSSNEKVVHVGHYKFGHDESLLSTQQVAEKYGVSRRTLQRWREAGHGPKWARLGVRRVVYRLADLNAWLWAEVR